MKSTKTKSNGSKLDLENGNAHRLAQKVTKHNLPYVQSCAEAGNTNAMKVLVAIHDSDSGEFANKQQALHWYSKLVEQDLERTDLSHFQYCLGFSYLHGQGVERNLDQAIHWLTKSAEDEDPDECEEQPATELLAEIYANPESPKHDFTRAAYWYKRCWMDGPAFELGLLYLKGLGVAKDLERAMECFDQALEGNSSLAKGVLLALVKPKDFADLRASLRHDR